MKNKLIIAGIVLFILWKRTPAISGAVKTKTKFLPVYIQGKPNQALIRADKKRPGVYIIKVNGEIKYIGYSATNVYKTILRHFQSWEDSRQVRITYPKSSNVTARIVYTNTGSQAAKLERALILKMNPPDNPNKYKSYQLSLNEETAWEDYTAAETEAPF